ncbi:P-loop containing nucleoside triphosphate hydrolase protein [Multifurca ochricompacta]|uniref:P-loop containing nucleoside triphosphate hydrolase protein n=1 Tax=Multifurca ochricompacta TaxID=376703 RepID=A0AAD4QR88_9AGAM|nr:P-loop containing nucleoside triphosphate hydrolase protein [Multifurca ochricompacta]
MTSGLRLASIFLPLFTLLNSSVEVTSDDTVTFMNATHNANATASATPSQMPTDFSSLITFIYSFSTLRDYFKFIVLGGALEALRQLYSYSYSKLVDRFFITATFDSEDYSYRFRMDDVLVSSLPQWRHFRDFSVNTNSSFSPNDALEIDENMDEVVRRRTRPVRYLPSYSASYKMWYKGKYLTVSRVKEESRWDPDRSSLVVTIFSRDRSVLDSLIIEARNEWLSARSNKISIYASEGYVQQHDWTHVASREKRSLDSIVLDDGIKELLLEDARDFLKSKQWYADRGIPFRRGYLLYGAPGSGKTSVIHSLSGELGLDIYIISLSKNGLDDASLNALISSLPEQCVAIMEDIDAAFTHGLTRDVTGTDFEDPRRDLSQRGHDDRDGGQARGQNPGDSPAGPKDSRITLSGLLNALDGISAQEGRILFATTNRYHALDPALTRPGRMDLHVEFRLASRHQARELYKRFYIPDTSEDPSLGEEEDETSSDSGYATPAREESEPTPSTPRDVGLDGPHNYNGTAHSARPPKLSKRKVERLAEQFAERIPEREFSMASLQGYLMAYKVRPFQAVDDVERWAKDTREAQVRRAEARDMRPRVVNVEKAVESA